MAKQDFICKVCKEPRNGYVGFFSTPTRYRCGKHGLICPDHVKPAGWLSGPTCRGCDAGVLTEQWDHKKQRWIQA
jgi:hypothetical protein